MLTEDRVPTKAFPQVDKVLSQRSKAPEVGHVIVPYQNFSIMKTISRAKFPVYVTVSKADQQQYAMKVFFYTRDVPGSYYKNEARFASLKHPNIINVLQHEEHIETLHKGQVRKASYILMEYAPHGDFFDFILQHGNEIDEKLARTYFRQLIEGIEYLHKQGAAHLDLKLDNLLLGADYNLKIADFDLSFINGDTKVISRGTKYSRAPELRPQGRSLRFEELTMADIYSAGIILFLLISGGTCPHTEGEVFKGVNLEEIMYQNNTKFWEVHSQLEGKSESYYDNDFRELFNNMVKFNPFDRYDIEKIKQSKWYNGPIYNQRDLYDKVESILHH